ncbi:hypothetical protein Tco_0809385 [Tanacetum coccineum]
MDQDHLLAGDISKLSLLMKTHIHDADHQAEDCQNGVLGDERMIYRQIFQKLPVLESSVSVPRVCKTWKKLEENKSCFILQNNELKDMCIVVLARVGDALVVKNQIIQEFSTRTRVISSLDEYLLVKEVDKNRLFVMNHLSKKRLELPETHTMGNQDDAFTIVYTGGSYKIVHLWNPKGPSYGWSLGCHLLSLSDVFSKNGTKAAWEERDLHENLPYSSNLGSMVTVNGRYSYWIVGNYLAKLDMTTLELSTEAVPIPDRDSVYMLEDRGFLKLLGMKWRSILRTNVDNDNVEILGRDQVGGWVNMKTFTVNQWAYSDTYLLPASHILFKRFFLYRKADEDGVEQVICYDLVSDSSSVLEGISYHIDWQQRWIRIGLGLQPQVSTDSGI